MDHSLPDSSAHGILQARIMEWVAVPSSRGSSPPRDRTCHLVVDVGVAEALRRSILSPKLGL